MFGALLFLLAIAGIVAFIMYKNPEFKDKVIVAIGAVVAAVGYFWEQISGWFN